jgi:hypothetical protein
MSSTADSPDALRRQAHDLYWNSSETVDGLTSSLGMSRKALYAAIEPIEAGAGCAECGDPLVFTNRTRRSSGQATCARCGTEERVETAAAAPPVPPVSQPASAQGTAARMVAESDPGGVHEVPPAQAEREPGEGGGVSADRAARLGGAAVLGAAIGAAAVRVLKNKG